MSWIIINNPNHLNYIYIYILNHVYKHAHAYIYHHISHFMIGFVVGLYAWKTRNFMLATLLGTSRLCTFYPSFFWASCCPIRMSRFAQVGWDWGGVG